MIAFIVSGQTLPHLFRQSVQSLAAVLPSVTPVEIQGGGIAGRINEILTGTDDRDPWFIILEAGDCLKPSFAPELEALLAKLPEHSAGAAFPSETAISGPRPAASPVPRAPLLWRKAAVLAEPNPGFAERPDCPFEKYSILEKYYQLSHRFTWAIIPGDFIVQSPKPTLYWQKEEEEWALISPLLQAPAHPVMNEASAGDIKPLVTFVICAYNDAAYLPWAIRSVMAQTVPQWELILIDDGSTDDTEPVLQRFAGDPRIRTIVLERNHGKAYALNRALREAGAEWILELDADDWLAPECAGSLLRAARERPEAAMIYAGHTEWTERMNKELLYRGHKFPSQPLSPGRLLDEAAPVAPRMFRVSALREKAGWNLSAPYDSRLYEDLELIVRLAADHEFHYVPEPLYHRRIRPSSITHRQRKETYREWRAWMLGRLGEADPRY
ncbi:glycosyltransferase family 2 protein [Paenibacillus sp. M1]|uniref:Glycosyltransferase family 2 protein n=1 Tax=Paenibacillus haidiansis TaxID=1574488 RepID=A0ABU7VQC2_9BACL